MEEPITFSPGATLRDIPPDFHGITLQEFYRRDVKAQCDAYLRFLAEQPEPPPVVKEVLVPKLQFGTKQEMVKVSKRKGSIKKQDERGLW